MLEHKGLLRLRDIEEQMHMQVQVATTGGHLPAAVVQPLNQEGGYPLDFGGGVHPQNDRKIKVLRMEFFIVESLSWI